MAASIWSEYQFGNHLLRSVYTLHFSAIIFWVVQQLTRVLILAINESTIMLSHSSQGESSVLRVRLRVIKNPLTIRVSRNEYVLVEVEYTSLPPSEYL